MGQVLHGSATTAHAIRASIQRWKATDKELADRHGINPKTVAKWKKRTFVHDAPMGPKKPRSTVLTLEEEAVAFGLFWCMFEWAQLGDCRLRAARSIGHLGIVPRHAAVLSAQHPGNIFCADAVLRKNTCGGMAKAMKCEPRVHVPSLFEGADQLEE